MASTKRYEPLLTPIFRGSYPHIDEPRENDDGRKSYEIAAVFPPGEELAELKKIGQRVLEDELGPDRSKWPKGAKLYTPFRRAEEKRDDDGNLPAEYPDATCYFLTLRADAKHRPPVVVWDTGTKAYRRLQDEEMDQVYGGAWYQAQVRPYFFRYHNKDGALVKQGLGFGLLALRKVRDDEPFGGSRVKPEEAFAPPQDEPDAEWIDDGADPLFA